MMTWPEGRAGPLGVLGSRPTVMAGEPSGMRAERLVGPGWLEVPGWPAVPNGVAPAEVCDPGFGVPGPVGAHPLRPGSPWRQARLLAASHSFATVSGLGSKVEQAPS